MKEPENKTGLLKDKMKGDNKKETPAKAEHMKHYTNERESIIRQTCIKAAAQVMSGCEIAEGATVGQIAERVVTLAEIFETWVNRKPDETTDSKN